MRCRVCLSLTDFTRWQRTSKAPQDRLALWRGSLIGMAANNVTGLTPRCDRAPAHSMRAKNRRVCAGDFPLERDDFSSNRHPALSFCLSMISGQTLRVCPEGKPVSTPHQVRGRLFPDHALTSAGRCWSNFDPFRFACRQPGALRGSNCSCSSELVPGRKIGGLTWGAGLTSCRIYFGGHVVVGGFHADNDFPRGGCALLDGVGGPSSAGSPDNR